VPSESAGIGLTLRDVSHSFDAVAAVDGVGLDVAPGEFLTLLGPSGSGKTTTLNMIAGFLRPDSGSILLGERDISRVPAHKRGIGMVFQHYALFPHMSVTENVAYPLKQRRVPKAERARKVEQALELVQLHGLGTRRPAQLSGGQQQRVALARALVFNPPLLLMDEPLGALDKRLREALQLEIKRIHEQLGITFVYVTHDQEEALLLSDRIAIFRDGQIDQVGTAEDLYERPRTRFVAEFVGDSNVFAGSVDRAAGTLEVDDGTTIALGEVGEADSGSRCCLVVRPERLRLTSLDGEPTSGLNVLEGTVAAIHYLGSARKLEVTTGGGQTVVLREPAERPSGVQVGERTGVCWEPGDGVLVVESGGATPLATPDPKPVSA
jgi:putative spermidine/putrescine transport system ATP-binding protein